jgi:hypothetical protein
MKQVSSISKLGLLSTLAFLFFSFLGRVLFPFGDEPDFTVRAPRVLYGEHPWWSPYNIFHDLLHNIQVFSNCHVDASRTSILAHIDAAVCTETFEQILIRFILTIVIVSPILFSVIFRKTFIFMTFILPIKLSLAEWNNRLDALSITLFFPGMIYYLGVLAEEQFTLVISLFIFLFLESFLIVLILLALIMLIDMGNSIVVLLFVLFTVFFKYIARKFSIKISFYWMFLAIVFAYLVGFYLLTYIEQISFLADKAQSMASLAEKGGFVEKYPVFLRPIITFMTAIFMPPSGLKIIPNYLIFSGLFVILLYRLRKIIISLDNHTIPGRIQDNVVKNKIILFGSSLTTIVFFVFLFPNYGNAKYYMFILPFILYVALMVHSKQNMIKLFIFSNIIMFINLIIYRY